jgi:hypothetical protein
MSGGENHRIHHTRSTLTITSDSVQSDGWMAACRIPFGVFPAYGAICSHSSVAHMHALVFDSPFTSKPFVGIPP